jgi:penicillin amidase
MGSMTARIYRDEWGIPHVRAASMPDLFAAQEYAHARDRLWQLDASRRQMQCGRRGR